MPLPAVGVDALHAAIIEAAYDTAQTIAAANCMGLEELKFMPDAEFHESMEHLGSSDLTHEFAGKIGGRWSGKGYIKPRAAGTPPDMGPLFLGSFGAVSGSTYSLANVVNTLQLMRYVGDSLQENSTGSWIEVMEIDVIGNQEPRVSFSGGFASYGFLRGSPITEGTANTGQGNIVLAAAHAGKIRAPAQLYAGANTNSGAGYRVTSVSADGLTVVVAPNIAGSNIATETTLSAHFPTPSFAGTVQGGTQCALTIAGTEVGFISYKLRLETGFHGLNREANTNRSNRVARGKRKITGSCSFYLLDETAARMGLAPWNGTTQAMTCRIGPNTADNRFTLSTPAVRLHVHEIEVPNAEEATFEAAWTARRASVNNDALVGTFP